jgi:soluble lytic murein transglycosylase-like protein
VYRRYVFIALSLLGVATPARAELVYFATGRTLNVKEYRREGALLVLTLRSGGEVVCEAALITRIAPDEAPYPEPVVEAAAPLPSGPGEQQTTFGTIASTTLYDEIIDRVAAREGVDAKLVRAVIEVESGYRPRARSPKGAMGLMQLMPATARQYAVTNPYDPATNIEAGIKHLKSLLARFPTALALAAYNAGGATVERFGGIPPYAETRNYVSRILQIVGRS